jgi:hypothetical protein
MGDDMRVERQRAFARRVFWKIGELEQQLYDERFARIAELEANIHLLARQTTAMANAARAAGRFTRYISFPRVGYPSDDCPGSFRLLPVNRCSPFMNAANFLQAWQEANPAAEPTAEAHLKCLADAESLHPPSPDFPKTEFVSMVSDHFEMWKQGG